MVTIDRPLRFCMFTTFYPPDNFGGDGIFVQRLSEALVRRGHHVEVVHAIDAYHFLGGDRHPPAANSLPRVHPLHSRIGGIAALISHQTGRPALYASQIKRILKEGHYDVIHFHNPSLLGGPGVFAYGDAVKLYTTHEHWLLCPTHTLWKCERHLCDYKTCFLCTLYSRRPPQLWRYTRLLPRMIQHLDAILCPSHFTCARHQEERMGTQVTYLPHFLPEMPQAATDSSAPPYFLAVGRLEKLKGIHTLLPVFSEYPDAELWIAGEGGYEKRLKQLAAANPRIRFLGQRSQIELASLYRNAIALLVPSLCYEVFGLVVLEGFAQSTPAIVRGIGALAEVIQDSGGGLLYSSQAELRSAMSRLQGNREERNALGTAGNQALARYWSEETHVSRYLEIIASLYHKKRGRR